MSPGPSPFWNHQRLPNATREDAHHCAMRLALLAALLVACGDSTETRPEDDASTPDADVERDTAPSERDTGSTPDRDAGLPDAGPRDAGSVDAGPSALLDVRWEPCTLFGMVPREGECATVDVPLFWERPESRRIAVHVTRYLQPGSRGQLWILIGGPGLSSAYLEAGASTLAAQLATDLDLYMFDYRGIGRSTRLGCPDQESDASAGGFDILSAEWPACIDAVKDEWGDDLAGFTTAETARDLGHLIDATRGDGQVFVYGVSYGSYLALRYLAEFPAQADGIVLEGLLPPATGLFPIDFEENHDRVGHELLDACGADAECASHVGDDPWGVLNQLVADLDAGHCPEIVEMGLDSGRLTRALALLVQLHQFRRMIPAIIHRAARCSPADVTALRTLLTAIPDVDDPRPPPDEMGRLDSTILHGLVVQNELYQMPRPTRDEVVAAIAGLRFASGGVLSLEDREGLISGVPPDEPWAETSIPVLMVHGEWDTQCPRENVAIVEEHIGGPNVRSVIVPRAPHEASLYSPTTRGSLPCASRIMNGFLADPSRALDLVCLDQLVPFDFSDLRGMSLTLFGTFDAWGDASM